MKVSVVIPFYSQIGWLEEAVDSVLGQTFKDYEIIIVNDGSPEDDKDFLKKYGDKVLYFKTKNKGPAHARNFGIDRASGEYIAFLDSDDLFCPTKLEKQVSIMDLEELNWSHTMYSTFDEVTDRSKRKYYEIANTGFQGKVFPKSLVSLNIGTPCVMVRREVLLQNSFLRFSERMRYGQDGYLWILMGVRNDLGLINESLTLVRRSGSNAVQRARIHLNVRANLYINLVREMKVIDPKATVPFIVKLPYLYCYHVDKILDKIFGPDNRRNTKVEMISKIVYLPAFFMFKTLKLLM
ncbi:glycosyltransferase family 2 protein [Sphingobacterium haloxyli]|uniref:Glycosyltransferase family 2 protein n=1 Tax=Sphingobacterium haloxyli TaxID=2100533 RepID=A0A2S9J200_9SPHI|nr:glycosyltransferase family 2 protein [Sphingobacterium haloxyli]PRD46808.1 glycosyltransferase family 2 protein [Sphingobacterium haloxyli]